MKIKLHLLATDGNNNGTQVDHFYTQRDLDEHLIKCMDVDDEEEAVARKLLDDGDDAGFTDWIEANTPNCFTWTCETVVIDTDKAEKVE